MQLHFNSTYIDVLPTDESYRYRSIMGEHTLNLYFALSTYTDIPTGAWCEFQGERYTLNQPAKVVKHNSRHFEYTLTMDSEGANLKNYKFRNPNDKTLKFPFTASPRYHIQILVDCLNTIDSGWQVGTMIEANEKLISYNHNNCLEALDMIAKAFETEYEIIGKTIHLHKVEYFKNNPLPLQYGKGKGFKTGVSRTTEQSRITRLYVQGGDRNIDRSKYGNKELLLPKSQEYVYEGVTFVSDDKGLSITIKNAQNNGFINEQSLDLSHIYPSRKGTVSAVFEVDKAKHFYDFADTSIPEALNFAELQIKGEKMVIYFESGMLSGREFEISRYEHSSGYNHSARRFEIVPKEEDGTTMPDDIFKPAVGDRYSVYNMHLPAAYICDNATKSGASWEMMKEACKYLYENRADLFTFTGDLDGIWAKKNWVNVGGRLKMGAYIHFSDNEFQRTPVAIRIVGLKEYVNNPYSPQIELSNKVQGQSFSSEIRKLQNQEVYFGEMNKKAISETKRSWRNALETIKQVEEAFPEYTKSIIPATVQTMMALVGNKSGQFAFVANKTNPITVPHSLYFDKVTKQIKAGSGWIKHYTLGTTDIKPSHSATDYKYWYVSQFVSGRLDDKAKSYYLYIKANKAIETAEFVLSETKIGMEQEAGFYHFLYATVNSEYDGERGIAQLNGFTEITGGQMVTSKISSGNGEQYIQLLDKEIIIKANLRITDNNKLEFKQLVNPDLQSLESRLKQYSNENNAKGEIYLRGTGLNRHAAPIIQINGQNIVPENYRGLYLAVIRRSDLQVIFNQNYDTYGSTEERRSLANKLNTLNSDVLVTLVSRDSAFVDPYILGTDELKNALIRCGANDDNSKYVSRMPYAFLGIPNIGKGNGIEVYTAADSTAPYAEIATKIINGTPQGMNNSFSGMLQTAKTATEAYARAQADLLKLQAIAEANRNAGLAITAEQQARIQEAERNLQAAKAHAEREVSKINIGGRNLVLSSKDKRILRGYTGIFYLLSDTVKPNEQYVFSCMSERNGAIVAYFSNELGGERQYISGNIQWGKNVDLVTPNRAWRGITIFHEVHGIIPTPTSSIELVKLERGNKPTDWSPAPEDVENQIANINSDLETIRRNAERIEDLENKNKAKTDERIGEIDQLTAFLNKTDVRGNVVATGTMIVGNTLGAKAGITGVGNANNEERFWAGETYDKRKQAPFRVTEDGSIYASKGRIGNFNIESGRETSLLANGLTIASNGIIKAFGGVTNRSTQVIINDPAQLQELVGTRPVASIYSSGFGETAHTALHLTSRGGGYNAALVLEAGNGTNGATAIDVRSGDILVKGKKSFSGTINIGNVKITVTNGIITGAQ
nr:MAG TPA: tail protein [Caudoviricetes sp.]